MRLYYIDESEGPRYYVRSALGVDAERWNDLFGDIYEWRRERWARATPSRRTGSFTPATCWPGGGFWYAMATATSDSPPGREPRSSWTGCAALRTPPPAWEA